MIVLCKSRVLIAFKSSRITKTIFLGDLLSMSHLPVLTQTVVVPFVSLGESYPNWLVGQALASLNDSDVNAANKGSYRRF